MKKKSTRKINNFYILYSFYWIDESVVFYSLAAAAASASSMIPVMITIRQPIIQMRPIIM